MNSLLRLVLLSLTLTPSLASANALFLEDPLVKSLDPESFENALEHNQTTMVAFISSSSALCQQIAPEYSRAALGLHPFVPAYAVQCDDEKNKALCKEQGVEVFPTVKLFPRGKTMDSVTYENTDDGTPTASAYYYWASRRIPNYVTKHYHVGDIQPWVEKTKQQTAILLLTKEKKVPLLWKVLANKFAGQLEMASHRDRKGKSSVALGMEAGEKKEAKILIYPSGSTTPFRYEGLHKSDSLSKFFDSIIDGTTTLKKANEEAKAEKFVPDEKELEIEQKQEAQRLALAHGGFSDFIDFEKAIKEGHGADFHDVHGYPGMMGGPPVKKVEAEDAESSETEVNPISSTSSGSSSETVAERHTDEL